MTIQPPRPAKTGARSLVSGAFEYAPNDRVQDMLRFPEHYVSGLNDLLHAVTRQSLAEGFLGHGNTVVMARHRDGGVTVQDRGRPIAERLGLQKEEGEGGLSKVLATYCLGEDDERTLTPFSLVFADM